MLSFPPTQWIRWRQPVIGMPTTPRILAPGQLLVVTHLGQVLVFDAHRGTVIGTPLDLVAGVDPTDSERGLADCRPAGRGARSPPHRRSPRRRPSSCSGCGSPTPRHPILVGLRYRPGQTPLLTREWTSDAVGGGPACQPGVLGRRGDGVRQRPRRPAMGAQRRRRQGQVVGAAGLPGADSTLGLTRRADRGGRRSGRKADRRSRTRATTARCDGPATTSRRCRHRANPAPTSPTPSCATATGEDAGQALLVFDPADGRTLNTYPLPRATGLARRRRRSATTAASSPPPATVWCTASHPPERLSASIGATAARGTVA